MEELEVFQKDQELSLAEARRIVQCRHCTMYSGTQEEMRKHEESHLATGELKDLPDCSDLYRRVLEAVDRDNEQKHKREDEKRMSEDYCKRLSELFLEKRQIQIPENFLKRLEISVWRKGKPMNVQEFLASLTSNRG